MADADHQKQHVLVFDDSRVAAHGIAEMLRDAGYVVEVATHFAAALDRIEGPEPLDLFIADVVVPEGQVGGPALVRMARMKRRGVKTILMTGYDTAEAERFGLGPVLSKPVSRAQLLIEVQRALAQ